MPTIHCLGSGRCFTSRGGKPKLGSVGSSRFPRFALLRPGGWVLLRHAQNEGAVAFCACCSRPDAGLDFCGQAWLDAFSWDCISGRIRVATWHRQLQSPPVSSSSGLMWKKQQTGHTSCASTPKLPWPSAFPDLCSGSGAHPSVQTLLGGFFHQAWLLKFGQSCGHILPVAPSSCLAASLHQEKTLHTSGKQ